MGRASRFMAVSLVHFVGRDGIDGHVVDELVHASERLPRSCLAERNRLSSRSAIRFAVRVADDFLKFFGRDSVFGQVLFVLVIQMKK